MSLCLFVILMNSIWGNNIIRWNVYFSFGPQRLSFLTLRFYDLIRVLSQSPTLISITSPVLCNKAIIAADFSFKDSNWNCNMTEDEANCPIILIECITMQVLHSNHLIVITITTINFHKINLTSRFRESRYNWVNFLKAPSYILQTFEEKKDNL